MIESSSSRRQDLCATHAAEAGGASRTSVDLLAPFRRLGVLVRARALHRHTPFHDPDAWLLHWLHTPRVDLDGRCPSVFVDQPDWDLVLVGLLLRPDALQRRSCLCRPL